MLAATLISASQAQTDSNSTIDSLQHFNKAYWLSFASRYNPSNTELTEFIIAQQRQYIRDTYYPETKPYPLNPGVQQSCTNIDFEAGNTNGWMLSTGFNPLFNVAGCCPTAGGAQAIMTGGAVDPCANFPVVCPGGNFSLRLGNNGIGGIADRIEQKFMVNPSNANFTYKYAVVFEDPGHTPAQQPSFQIEMLDSNKVQIPCTFYNVTAGQGIPGFLNSPSCPSVIYKPWSSVVVDLTNYIGQNVTIRFTTYDCALGGHYGYAYIDGSCMQFQLATRDTICVGGSKNICAANGFGSYIWNGPGLTNFNGQCANVSLPGTYSVQTTMMNGCVGPVFTYSIYNYSNPQVVISSSNSSCSKTWNFINGSTIAMGSITSYTWNFGDGTTSSLINPTHTYAAIGTYSVTLTAVSNKGCYNSANQVITINPTPTALFTFSNNCAGSPSTIIDNSSGSISTYSWNFGDGSPLLVNTGGNPSHTYAGPGNYSITLTVSSSQGCASSLTQLITVYPLPIAAFTSVNNSCSKNISFTNSSTISSGSITSYLWNFGDGGTSAQSNPNYVYTNAGSYSVMLTATSNFGCTNTIQHPLNIYPMPVVNFNAPVICERTSITFTNTSAIASGSIAAWVWNFGDGTSMSNLQSPSHTYSVAGNFIVTLNAVSNFGCSASNTISVKVWPAPFVSFTSNNVCFGVSSQFINNSSVPTGSIVTWNWDFNGDGIVDNTNQTPYNLYTSPGSYSVILTAVTNANCTNSYSTTVTVNPVPNVSFVGNNVCNGSATTFSNQTTIGYGGQITSYLWNLGNGTTNNSANPFIIYATPGNYVVSLTATSNNNCFSSMTTTVVVHPNPVVNFTTTTTCFNQPTQFTNGTTIQTGTIIKYRWDFDGNNTWDDSTANPVHLYANYGSFNGKLAAISNNNCASQKVNPVVVHANPIANWSANSTCLGDMTNFTDLSTCADGNITSWQWDFNGDNIVDNLFQNPTKGYGANGVYLTKLEVQSQYGCVSTMSKPVYVNPKPIAKFNAYNKIGCPTLCTNFTNFSTIPTGNIVTYQWTFGDGSLPDYTKNPTHCYQSGTYNVTLKVVSDSGCFNSYTEPNIINVYPKPIAGFNVTPDQIDQNEPVGQITNTSQGANWTFYQISDGTNLTNPANSFVYNFNPDFPGKVVIFQIVRNEYGCTDSLAKVIEIKPAYVIYVPNAFTPNTDGLNDSFKAQGIGIAKFQMWIFDRWGHIIFESNDINKGWDGTVRGGSEPIKDDVYVWKAEVTDVFSKNHDLVGHVTLLK